MKSKMKLWMSAILFAISSLFFTNCAKENPISQEDEVTNPVLTTNAVTDVTQTTGTSGGVITSDGGATISARGVCWSTNPSPTIANNKTTDGTGAGSFTSAFSGLTANTTYYVRAYVISNKGADYGNEISFTTQKESTPITTTVTDIDGNTYKTINIGTQTWMAENLKVTKYNDETNIPNVTDASEWWLLKTGALCDYDNTPSNSETYGKLYNWHAVNTGKLCPAGWHVPTNAEWTQLTTYLEGENIAGGKLKETGTTHWLNWSNSHIGVTNVTGFTALPGGYRESFGSFSYIGKYGYWWSATDYDITRAWSRNMSYNSNGVSKHNNYLNEAGFSVRCIKD